MNFFRTAPASAHPPMHDMPSAFVDRTSTSSHSSSGSGFHFEEPEMNDERMSGSTMGSLKEEKVYVAVPNDAKEWKANLLWVLQNIPRSKKIVILHIHSPAKTIPFMGAYFPADYLAPDEVVSFRQMEARKMNQNIAKYMTMCSRVKVKTEMVITSMDDVAEGIITLISQRGITELFMGAAADEQYSKSLKVPTSRTAITVQQRADQMCKIWFLCKGNVICTREAVSVGHSLHGSHRMSSSSISSFRSDETPSKRMHNYPSFLSADSITYGSRTTSFDSRSGDPVIIPPSPDNRPIQPNSIAIDLWDGNTSKSDSSRFIGSHVIKTEVKTKSLSSQGNSGDNVLAQSRQSDTAGFSTLNHYLNEAGVNKEMYMDFQNMLSEAEKLRREAYMETLRRQKEEQDIDKISKSAKTDDSFYSRDVSNNKEHKTKIQRPSNAHSYEEIRKERDEIIDELKRVQEQRAQLELELINSKSILKDLQEKLSEAHSLLLSLEQEQEHLRQDRDCATREIQQLRAKIKELESCRSSDFSEFTYTELQEATNNFDDSLKIGEGGYGSVYRGVLRSTDVAIKLLNPQGMQGKSEFHKEMDVLSKVRHPHLVTLIGACPEAWALVYEFLPNGSLEDRLTRKDNTPPLTWQARCRIAAEICSALVFLHTLKPLTVIHGDLKPANILLDANFISRLGDFGICRLLEADASTILFRCTHPMGTFAYMDPEFLASGELRPCSDVYAFGIILLRLLTGRQAMGIINQVHDAVDEERLQSILDKAAGEWPFDLAMQLAELGLKCCEIKRKNRPDLSKDAWKILEPLMQA
ncbi:U-box domain-containing protein kinase family protein [Rhynchospora pubera]|uniref:RING-type E3 ubiquitin transferase n=1 Tax=Rhynchospora pubera TaxID=906938 RepID=A0AAV8EE08_9POAL|nr:U-box domain-containing protein kinase family protein [Rhynchospora pubera]